MDKILVLHIRAAVPVDADLDFSRISEALELIREVGSADIENSDLIPGTTVEDAAPRTRPIHVNRNVLTLGEAYQQLHRLLYERSAPPDMGLFLEIVPGEGNALSCIRYVDDPTADELSIILSTMPD